MAECYDSLYQYRLAIYESERPGKFGRSLAAVALGAPLVAIFAVIAFAMLVYGLFTGLAVYRSKWPTER